MMNINSLVEKIMNYKEKIQGDGYFRDIEGFKNTLSKANVKRNIIMTIVDKMDIILNGIYQSSIPDDMLLLLPNEKNYQFIEKKYYDRIEKLKNDTEINTLELYGKMVSLVNEIYNHINNDMTNITKLEKVFLPYFEKDNDENKKNEKAIISIVFNNKKSYHNLPSLVKTLSKWNRLFQIYSQLLKSEPSEDIEVVSVHDGSLDFIFNFNIDLSINLTEVVKYGLIAFGGFFAYLKVTKPIIDSYLGNEELIEMEYKRKDLMLNNIYESIAKKISEQHKDYVKKDNKINQESIDRKIEEISKIITEHLIEGNEIKLLTSNLETTQELKAEIKEKSQLIKNEMRVIDRNDILLLENKYKIKDEM